MSEDILDKADSPSKKLVFLELLDEARRVSRRVRLRLRALSARFPTELPPDALEQANQNGADPANERRDWPQ
jgi:hypothetical protein